MPKADKFCGISGSEAEGIFQRDPEHVHAIADRRGHVECRARQGAVGPRATPPNDLNFRAVEVKF